MDFDPVVYLASKGLRGKPASGGTELTYPCFFECAEPPDSRKRKLYLQVGDGFYNCKVCGAYGGSYMLQKHFGDEPRQGTNDDGYTRRRILDAAVEAGQTMLDNNDDVLLYLVEERGLTYETIKTRKIGFVAGGWSLTGVLPEGITREQVKGSGLVHRDGAQTGKDFFYRHILIPYLSHGHCIQMRGRIWGESSGGKYMTGPGDEPRLFNGDRLEGAEDVIITEGEFDGMILEQELRSSTEERAHKIAVVSLAGTHAIPSEFDAVLANAKRIYVGFDSDEAGRRAAEKMKERIGTRARILDLPSIDGRKCDWTEYLLPKQESVDFRVRHPYAGHTWKDVLRLLSTAAGKRVFSMAEAGESFRTYRENNDGLKTGFTGLDETILPGLLPGQVVVVLAKTGTGKTVFLCNLCYNMRAHRILLLSLEMMREEVYDRLRRIYLFHHPEATDAIVESELSNIYICDENRVGEKDLDVLVSEFAVETGHSPDIVMVDYLGYFARGARGNSPYEKVSNAVMALKAAAKAGRYVAISPSQVSRVAKEGKPIDLDGARDAGAVEETADFLLALFRPDDALQADIIDPNQKPSGKVRCALLKSRHGGKGKIFTFQMDMLSLVMVDELTPAARKADEHNNLAWRGLTWDDMRARETAPRQLSLRGNF